MNALYRKGKYNYNTTQRVAPCYVKIAVYLDPATQRASELEQQRASYKHISHTNTPQIQIRLSYKHASDTNTPQLQTRLKYKYASATNTPRIQTRLTMMRSHGLEMAAPMAPDTRPANSWELKLSVPAPCGVSCRLKTSYSPIFEQLYVAARKIYGQSRVGNMSVPKL